MDRKSLGAAVRGLRNQRDLKLRQVEKPGEFTYQYVSDVERGRANVTIDTLNSIVAEMGGEVVFTVLPAEALDEERRAILRRFAELAPRVSPDFLDGLLLGMEARAKPLPRSEEPE
jgi:transcriptional regulator with XRE-family HTH domain